MSKRYREVLEEVETPASRRAAVPDAAAAADDSQEHPPGTGGKPPHEPVAGTGGGVATLARPQSATARQRDGRPGNGPVDADEPLAFTWRGRHYEVTRILGHWREESGWWRRPDGEPIRIEQSDLWRVEAARNPHAVMASDGPHPTGHGVYELARRGQTWRLDRVWD